MSTTNTWYQQSLVSIADLSKDDINIFLKQAHVLKQKKAPNALSDKIISHCFFEASTRTRLSFEAASNRLGAKVIGFSDPSQTSYQQKGESLSDTLKVIGSYSDALVLRTPQAGAARLASEILDIPVINAGDGGNQHPTQTLLDLYAIYQTQGSLEGLNIAFVGDLKYGRTVHSLVKACAMYDMRLFFIAPEHLSLPDHLCRDLRNKGVRFSCHDALEKIPQLDILYVTRLQKERFDPLEYKSIVQSFIITPEILSKAKENLKVLHPMPRVQEIDPRVDHTPYAYYFQQAKEGVLVRQAILSLILQQELMA